MKTFFIVLFSCLSLSVFSQWPSARFQAIDSKVIFIRSTNIDSLATQLAALGQTDIEKVRAIFRWITLHIDYNVKIFNRNKNTPGLFYEEPEDSSAALPSLDVRVAAKALHTKIAFCDGYSRLFKTLCDYSGIRSEIIPGYVRTNTNRSGRFGVNHIWNAVYFDSAWHLLDVTWASGFVSYANEYVRQFDESYFLTTPDQFIKDHYPEDPVWTLLADPPVYREFNQSPFRYSGYIKAGISSHLPSKGIINALAGDTIHIELKTKKEIRNLFVTDSANIDSIQLTAMPPPIVMDEKFIVYYIISPNAGKWLYVFCNDELVLRYRLNVKNVVPVNK